MTNFIFLSGSWWWVKDYPKKPGILRYDWEENEYQEKLKEYLRLRDLAIKNNKVEVAPEDSDQIFEWIWKNSIDDAREPIEGKVYPVDLEMGIVEDKCKSAVCELNQYCWFEVYRDYKKNPKDYKISKALGKKMLPMIDNEGKEITKCNTRKVARIKPVKEGNELA